MPPKDIHQIGRTVQNSGGGEWVGSNVVGIICPPGTNRINCSAKNGVRGGGYKSPLCPLLLRRLCMLYMIAMCIISQYPFLEGFVQKCDLWFFILWISWDQPNAHHENTSAVWCNQNVGPEMSIKFDFYKVKSWDIYEIFKTCWNLFCEC